MTAAVMNEDRISNLPDDIMYHILSFLDMKIVVQTCILSKRWSPLYKILPCLNFISKQTTLDFVDTALLVRDPSANIHAITLHLDFVLRSLLFTPLGTLIHLATLQGIQILDLQLYCYQFTIKLPQLLFTCQSLVTLKLRVALHSHLFFPNGRRHVIYVESTSVKLPLLKTLHLESFCFRGNQFIQRLFLGSPLLENIAIINCGLHGSQNLTISTTQLKYLEIDNIYACIGCCGSGTESSWDDAGVDIIHGRYQHFKNCKVEISAPMLTAFKCRAQISDQYLIHDLSSLATADIDMDIPKRCDCVIKKKLRFTSRQLVEFGGIMMKFIQALHNATSLRLGTALLEVLRLAIIRSRPTSYSAKYLKVRTSLSRDSVLATNYLLENSCNLEKLSIEITKKQSYYSKMGNEAEFPTECRLDQLRFVEIWNIQGSKNELEFLAFLLNKAIILEKLIIVCEKPAYWDNKKKWLKIFIETLRTFQIVSSRAMILLQVKDSNTRLIIQPKEHIKKLGSKVIIGKESGIVVWDTFVNEVTWVAIDPSLWKTLTSEEVCYNSFARELC